MSVLSDPNAPDRGTEDGAVNSQIVPTAANKPEAAHFTQPTESAGTESAPTRRLRPALLIGTLVLVAAGLGAYLLIGTEVLGDGDTGEPEASSDAAAISAVTTEQRDLIEYTDLDGTLTYADSRTIAAGTAGVVTAVAQDGDRLERGDVLYEVNAQPVVLFYGDTPLYRLLEEGTEGDDVMVLESNLASLGFHIDEPADTDDDDTGEVDTGFTVDGVFDAATADAVQRWQADQGVEETAVVDPSAVIVTSGPAVASGINVAAGDSIQPGTPIMGLNVTGTTNAFYLDRTGVVELRASTGEVTSGQVLYIVDDVPVTAVVTEEAFERNLAEGVEDGDDIAVVEQMLVDLGYDARGDLVPDDEFDELTTEAIEAWEEDLQDTWDDQVIDGELDLDQIVVVEPGTSVDDITDPGTGDGDTDEGDSTDGETVATGSELFTWSNGESGRVVTTTIDVADQERLVEGDTVDIEFPDSTVEAGTVTEVATSSTLDPMNPDAAPTLAVEIAVSVVPETYSGLNELDVTVKLVDELAANVTVVPASSLMATGDGGYAVEIVDGSTTRFVAVETGMFADGFVEVSGIEPGTAVVVPS